MQAAQQSHSTLRSQSGGLYGFTKNMVISPQDESAIFSACRFLNIGSTSGMVKGLKTKCGSAKSHTPQLKASGIQFPVSTQGSFLDFLFVQQQIECRNDQVRPLPQLLGKVPLADNHVSSRELLTNVAGIGRNPARE